MRQFEELLESSNTFTKCQKYNKQLISEKNPDGETEIYIAYYSKLDIEKGEVRNGEEIIEYIRNIFDVQTFGYYIMNLNLKIDRQHNHLLNKFKTLVFDLLKDLEKEIYRMQ